MGSESTYPTGLLENRGDPNNSILRFDRIVAENEVIFRF